MLCDCRSHSYFSPFYLLHACFTAENCENLQGPKFFINSKDAMLQGSEGVELEISEIKNKKKGKKGQWCCLHEIGIPALIF